MAPHSSKVRGTLSHPKTQEAKEDHATKGNPTQLGDQSSLKPETSPNDPKSSKSSSGTNAHPSDPYERSPEDRVNQSSMSEGSQGGIPSDAQDSHTNQPHSAKVRGTLSHPGLSRAMEQPRSMLGDHVSLKAETSDTKVTDQDRGAGPPKDEEAMKKAATERGVRNSKL